MGEAKACRVGRGSGKGCARDAVKAFLRGTWESKQLLVSLCRPVVEFAFFALSLCASAYVCVSVCGCVSLSEPPIHNNNDDATTAWRQNAGWDRVQNFSVPKKKKKTKQSYFLATLLALLFCIFLIISPCRIIVRHIKANLYLHKYFPCISLSFFRSQHSFSLEILRRVNLESFFCRNALNLDMIFRWLEIYFIYVYFYVKYIK